MKSDHVSSREFLDDFYSVYTHLDPEGSGITADKLNLTNPVVKAQYQKAKLPYADKITFLSAAKVLLHMHREHVSTYIADGRLRNSTVGQNPDLRKVYQRDNDCNTEDVLEKARKDFPPETVNKVMGQNFAAGWGHCFTAIIFSECWEYGWTWGREGQSFPYRAGPSGLVLPAIGAGTYGALSVADTWEG
ncbi:hypothetical protein HK097_009285 [Rhizophlyctis rosea]|uniref:Uncharacterized protein n=1 Tax=Rhizophlyctis rosea TaxID=64517 RepID=A0AAD5SKR5_9FUNG|nr:hypothetical protein HK097_009285 [Rhizophlyctis rosea]